ncbi:MAG TPA: beta-N-acetylhexosaminidase [Candidatus Lustribacter sp.]
MNDLRRLAAGVVAVGFNGTTLGDDVVAALAEVPLAGFVLFGRNVESVGQTRTLTDALRACFPADLPPVLGIDQEGGRVLRIREGVEEIPSMMAVAATGNVELARRAGEQTAFDLRRAGLNVNFAPVLDLALERMNTVIGTRSFGSDPQQVVAFAGAFAAGLRAGGIVATYKHFPGHGSTAVDSHLNLPSIDLDEATFRARDLVPFARLLPGAQALMTAHIVVRALDPDRPATLSRAILTGILRDEIGYDGVVFTDCMQMDAIARGVGSAPGAALAIAAGADCVLISHSLQTARESVEAIEAAVASGDISHARLEEAYERVRRLRTGMTAPEPLDAPAPHPGIAREIGREAVTLLRGVPHADPTADVAISFESTTTEGVVGTHSVHPSLRREAPALQEIALPLDPTDEQIDDALAKLDASGRRPIVLMRRAHVYARQERAVREIVARRPDAVLISTREPFDALLFDNARTVLCTYGDDRPSLGGLADVLFGGHSPQGHLPLEMSAV